ncbi:hypothetical protein HXX76_013328 [Chlamydomonas incerta]|uniref:Uncharacterized protein n=1 Tax=Chlamydomonas incerta TaxID=51695 RepID=A0A835SSH5_CHLIN|nr:hypothetical protein HXX76_013328 [Chlamydomonas incerta]|eukprot:KAG2425955.1 hypothetical protein HXX76_013328 [Chlamydomonas incerta]
MLRRGLTKSRPSAASSAARARAAGGRSLCSPRFGASGGSTVWRALASTPTGSLNPGRHEDQEISISRRIVDAAARVEQLAAAVVTAARSSAAASSPRRQHQCPHDDPTALFLDAMDALMTAVADVRACAVLAQRYDTAAAAAATRPPCRQSGQGGGADPPAPGMPCDAAGATEEAAEAAAARLMAAMERLVAAAAAEDAVLRSPTVFAALQSAAVSAVSADVQHSGSNSSGTTNSKGGSAGLPPHRAAMVAALAPRFVRHGYHPPSPHAYAVALRAEDKAAMLEDARRQERALLAALEALLGPAPPPPPEAEALPTALQQMHDQAYAADGSQGLPADEAAWLEAQLSRQSLATAAGAAAGRLGPALSYEWPVYDLGAEELQGDRVMADVAAAQWRQQGAGGGTAGGGGAAGPAAGGGPVAAGGQLRLTLDVCAGLLRRHPDPVLRQQVYEEGLAPLAAASLELLQRLRDVRAQQAALYGMYEPDLWQHGGPPHAVHAPQGSPYGPGPGGAAAARGGTGLWASLLPPWPHQMHQTQQPAGGGAGAAAGPGYAALAHMDSLARDGRAAVLFLTALAGELAPAVEAQVHQLAPTASGPLAAGDLEYGLRRQAWRRPRPPGDPVPAAAPAGTGTQQPQHTELDPDEGLDADHDPVAPYLSDPAALLSGVSDWLQGFMGVRLLRPGGPHPHPASRDAQPQPQPQLHAPDCHEATTAAAYPAGDGDGDGVGAGEAPPPADVAALLDDLRPGLRGAGNSGAAAADGSSSCGHREAALAALAAAAGREPGRFLAYRLELEGEGEREGREVLGGEEGQGAGAERGDGWDGHGAGGVEVRRWLLIDLHGDGGTRYLLPPVAPPLGGPAANSSNDAPQAVAVLVGLQGAAGAASSTSSSSAAPGLESARAPGGREGTDAVGLLARGSEFAVWELMHELGHAIHFLLAAAPPPLQPQLQPAPQPRAGEHSKAPRVAQCLAAAELAGTGDVVSGESARDAPPAPAVNSAAPGVVWGVWGLPYLLPLELVELPSCLLERAAAEPDVAVVLLSHCRDAAGRPPPAAVTDALARAVRVMHFSPVSVQVQVLCSLLDQLLLASERKAPGAAQRLWPQLLQAFGPSLPAAATVQQLHALPRLAGAGGGAAAYPVAAFLAAQLWAGGAAEAGAGAGGGGGGQPASQQRQQEHAVRGRPGSRSGKGRVLRRLLFESGGGQPAEELLRRVMGWGATEQAGGAITQGGGDSESGTRDGDGGGTLGAAVG